MLMMGQKKSGGCREENEEQQKENINCHGRFHNALK